jgi:CRISPR-associated endonuclease/helicase Cas3
MISALNYRNGVQKSRETVIMATNVFLAHSPHGEVPGQAYFEHITDVQSEAVRNARKVAQFYDGDKEALIGTVDAAALFHDLGKLDEANQSVLNLDSRRPLPIAHVDAGVAALLRFRRKESAVLAAAHHAGLFGKSNESHPNKIRPFRDERKLHTLKGGPVDKHVDNHLSEYLSDHGKAGLGIAANGMNDGELHRCGFTRRIALSCLVDADHGDTARHYGKEVEIPDVEPRWEGRLAALQRYVDRLPEGNSEPERKRNSFRKQLFDACRDAPLDPALRTCDAPVGSGKTTAVMAHLLRLAAEREPKLRHIFVVLPYTNIITQSVEIYRKALVLEGERPEDVVAEHHHRSDFAEVELRQLATLWRAPIIVTTAVQFFETLGSHHPATLRKLHELPGSAVFVDEMHAAIPSHLWPQVWRWLEIWIKHWGGHLVLASGSLPRFWELDEYNKLIRPNGHPMQEISDLAPDSSLREEMRRAEVQRVCYRRRAEGAPALDCEGLVKFVQAKPGPRLVIVNTVHTAAVVAQSMRESGIDVLHLSTALAPVHRDLIIERIKLRLRSRIDDWTLVATSCVEAGMDFSFRTGFRERASTASLIQIGGRISRGDEFRDAEVWDILLMDDRFRGNPGVSISRLALDYFSVDELNSLHSAHLATLAMKREWTSGAEGRARQLIHDEQRMEYPLVGEECRVIETDTRTVVIDAGLAQSLKVGRKISRLELMRYSVQIWSNKIDKLRLDPLIHTGGHSDVGTYFWQYDYDPDFTGYMKGVLKIEEFISAGGAVI